MPFSEIPTLGLCNDTIRTHAKSRDALFVQQRTFHGQRSPSVRKTMRRPACISGTVKMPARGHVPQSDRHRTHADELTECQAVGGSLAWRSRREQHWNGWAAAVSVAAAHPFLPCCDFMPSSCLTRHHHVLLTAYRIARVW